MPETMLARADYLGLLARAPEADVAERMSQLGVQFGSLPSTTWLRKPQTGMVMIRARIGGNGAQFNAGEATLTRCALRLEDGTVGVGYVRGCSARHAELIALADALAQQEPHRAAISSNVFAPLAEAEQARRAQRSAEVAASKVDFFTLARGDD